MQKSAKERTFAESIDNSSFWDHNKTINSLRSTEFDRLNGTTFLDHAGNTLYAKSQLSSVFSDLSNNIYSNPHSHHASSQVTADLIDQVRFRILRFFNVSPKEYSVIFTSSCTAALKLLAEAFDWNICDDLIASKIPKGHFAYLEDNHTSVIGMRELAKQNGAAVVCLSETDIQLLQARRVPLSPPVEDCPHCNNLFAYSAQCNFSGRKFPLSWIDDVRKGLLTMASLLPFKSGNSLDRDLASGFELKQEELLRLCKWYVVLDCAGIAGTSPLDLHACSPDFATLSFYKMFGYPTGIGALLVKNTSEGVLKKRYFGGGTVQISLAREDFYVEKQSLSDKFEDGTIPFLDIIALRYGFDVLEGMAGGIECISLHTFTLAKYVYTNLTAICHDNGAPVVRIYNDTQFKNIEEQGGIINFNILRMTGDYVGYSEVDKMASVYEVHVRTGCFCNTGACQRFLDLTSEKLRKNYNEGHVCGDNIDLIDGAPTGSVRVSFGWMSTFEDAEKFLKMIEECFVEKEYTSRSVDVQLSKKASSAPVEPVTVRTPDSPTCPEENLIEHFQAKTTNIRPSGNLAHIYLYPIKSCGAMEVREWRINEKGLIYDREWMLTMEPGVALTQKKEPRLCLVKPWIDLAKNELQIHFPGTDSLVLPLDSITHHSELSAEKQLCFGKVCGDNIEAFDCGVVASEWLSKVLNKPGIRLLYQSKEKVRHSKKGADSALSFANEAQYLLLSQSSIESLAASMGDASSPAVSNLTQRFRGNFVIENTPAFAEDDWNMVKIGYHIFRNHGGCTRCQVICVNQSTGDKTPDPLQTLRAKRSGKVTFGIYLGSTEIAQNFVIQVGDIVTAYREL